MLIEKVLGVLNLSNNVCVQVFVGKGFPQKIFPIKYLPRMKGTELFTLSVLKSGVMKEQ